MFEVCRNSSLGRTILLKYPKRRFYEHVFIFSVHELTSFGFRSFLDKRTDKIT